MDDFFNDKNFVEEYYKMIEGFDNSFVIEQFKKNVPYSHTVLELGFGTGLDYLSLREHYKIIPSDNSDVFIEKFKQLYNIQAQKIDAANIIIDKKFNCIFSNKVLHVFNEEEMRKSIECQYNTLLDNGMIFHCMWYDINGINDEYSTRYNEEKIQKVLGSKFEVIYFKKYSEIDENDSIIFIGKKI